MDLIVRQGEILIFVEVKARRTERYGGTLYAVHRRKEERMIKLAAQYLAQHTSGTIQPSPCRFDVILCRKQSNGPMEIQHIENAFEVAGEDLRW